MENLIDYFDKNIFIEEELFLKNFLIQLQKNILYKEIFLESENNTTEIAKKIKELDELEKQKLYKQISKELKINYEIALTFGTGVNSLIGPFSKMLNTLEIHSLNFSEIVLLLISFIASIKLTDSSILENTNPTKLKSVEDFNKVKKLLINSFYFVSKLTKKLSIGIDRLLDVAAYTLFSIPIIEFIKKASNNEQSIDSLIKIIAATAGSAGIITTKSGVKKLLNKTKEIVKQRFL